MLIPEVLHAPLSLIAVGAVLFGTLWLKARLRSY